MFRTIFAQPDPATVSSTWDQVRDQLGDRFPKIAALMDDAKTEVVSFCARPPSPLHQDLVNEAARATQRRTQATRPRRGHLPNEASVIRPVGAVLADVVALNPGD